MCQFSQFLLWSWVDYWITLPQYKKIQCIFHLVSLAHWDLSCFLIYNSFQPFPIWYVFVLIQAIVSTCQKLPFQSISLVLFSNTIFENLYSDFSWPRPAYNHCETNQKNWFRTYRNMTMYACICWLTKPKIYYEARLDPTRMSLTVSFPLWSLYFPLLNFVINVGRGFRKFVLQKMCSSKFQYTHYVL